MSAAMKTSAIEIEGLEAGYRDAPVLRGISCLIEPGEMVGVIGPNGAGKTTLLRALTGLIKPARGTIRLLGENLEDISARRRARLVGVVPQSVDTPMAFTVEEIVAMGRTAALKSWGRPAGRDRRIIEKALVYTDTADMRGRFFSELSGGEKQRAVIAMVLAQEPRIILMDEPTSHLDINHRIEIMQIVERLNGEAGVTVLMVSHDLNLSAEFCRRLVLVHHGRIVSDGAPAQVLKEETLRRVYECDVRVQCGPADGSVTVAPAPRLLPEHSGRGLRVHVVAGGGCGAEILRRLVLAEYSVTCGVLNGGDSDAEVCEALDIDTALETPFSPVGSEALARAMKMAGTADAVVVCGVPFGTGNVANLDLAEAAARRGKTVLILDGVGERDYTPDRAAARRFEELKALGVVMWESPADLVRLLPSALGPGPCLKRRFPFRLGTTSYIVPAEILPNVRMLADRLDDVEIVLFESDEISNLPSAEAVSELARIAREKDLSYTIHLPIDIRLGAADEAVRRASVEKCLRVMRLTRPLAPFAYVAHFHAEEGRSREKLPAADIDRWRGALDRSVKDLLSTEVEPAELCVETLAYPFELVEEIVARNRLSICLDLGHLLLYGYDVSDNMERYMGQTRVVHLHGLAEGKDHRDISKIEPVLLGSLIERLCVEDGVQRVVTIEVFGKADFERSMEVMAARRADAKVVAAAL